MTKWVYNFGSDNTEGSAKLRNLLGGKGANLAEMASMGLPVPSGFTITTDLCTEYYNNGEKYPDDLKKQVEESIELLEKDMDAKFGDVSNPLLVSVRSGARVSMPGMMDTVLNLGLNDETINGLIAQSGDERFAWDSYRRFIQMYSDVVLGVDHHDFEDIMDSYKRRENLKSDTDITASAWREIVEQFKNLVNEELGRPFPMDPKEQLWGAITAVFGSWSIARAVTYRKIHDIPESWGTAVNVQSMVFGNMGEDCATGVAFTRDPSTGENYFYGEYLINAQGEDVVAGIRTPQSLTIKGKEMENSDAPSMEEVLPEVFAQLNDVRLKLEKHYTDMQDIEFTVQKNKLYMLQTRAGKRTAEAALKIAVDMVAEGLISEEEAINRIEPMSLDQLLHPRLDPDAERDVMAKGLPASPGAANGVLVFNADKAEKMANAGVKIVLARTETSPEDIHGMHAAEGILTTRGGMTSHAAVVARGMGCPCVSGAGSLSIDYKAGTITNGTITLNEGDEVTIDGSTGEFMIGKVATIQPKLSQDFEVVMGWADKSRRMNIRTNAETPNDAKMAIKFGAEGIGLCRTEHMFFEASRIQKVREMIIGTSDRKSVLNYLLDEQKKDFVSLFKIMSGLPVTVRLLDPPLHEFLPHGDDDIKSFAETAGLDIKIVKRRLSELSESNPMLGHRGCRLGITFPDIYAMQARAIIEAALEVKSETGEAVVPEIMVPLVSKLNEFSILKKLINEEAEKVFAEKGDKVEYLIGTMIELPRAALTADEIAQEADFFSFGTNDLTQTCLGLSRDDAGNFLPEYIEKGIFEKDPFVSIDIDGVGALVDIAVTKGRKVKADIKLGICGEHGGDPASIAFFESIGLGYISCSPYRVPIARLAAAQSAIKMANKIKKAA